VNHEQVLGLQAQLKEMSAHLEGLEKERDFYFAKVRFLERGWDVRLMSVSQLRDIEILVQQQIEDLAKESREDATLMDIQKILYSTEVRRPVHLFFFLSFDRLTICNVRRALKYRRVERRRAMRRRRFRRVNCPSHVYLASVIPVVPRLARFVWPLVTL